MRISFSNDYTLLHWRDRIWKIGPDGMLIPKRDENGDILLNPLSGQPKYKTIEDGTRVTAKRLNHMDEGIYNAHEFIVELARLIRRMQIQMELDGRVPSNSGSFADTFDGTATRLALLTASTDVITPVTAGSDVEISVASTEDFTPMTYATIYDADSYEHVLITAVDTDANTITVQTLTSDYTKGAKIARSTAGIDTDNQTMVVAPFVTYQVELVEVV